MQKIHGTYSIQPLTLTDLVVSDTAGIQEHKLDLDFNTSDLNSDIEQVAADLAAHEADNNDPHGGILYQSTIRSIYVESSPSASDTEITVRNAGAGSITMNVEGDISAVDLYGRDAYLTRDLVVDGNTTVEGDLVVNGTTTTVNSNVVDYDIMEITPSSLGNYTALKVSPDDEGGGTGTYTGDLFVLEKRIGSVNSDTFKVDSIGNVYLYDGNIHLQDCVLDYDGSQLNINKRIDAPSFYASAGFIYIPDSDSPSSEKTFNAKKSDGTTDVFYITKGGHLYIENGLQVGASNLIYWEDMSDSIFIPENIRFDGHTQTFFDSPIEITGAGKTKWTISNRGASTAFMYGTNTSPTVEFNETTAYINQATLYTKDIVADGGVAVAPGAYVDGVDVDSHDHSGAAGMGVRLPATSVIGLQEFLDAHVETTQDIVGGMVTGNTEKGISVSYADSNGKLNFDVSDFTLTLNGDVSGQATITDLTNTALTVTVANDSHNHSNLTGTTSSTYHLDSDGAGPILQNSSGSLQVRNSSNSDYANLYVKNLYVSGSQTVINSEVVSIADNILYLNSNVVGTPTEDAGLEVSRGTSTNATLLWDEGINRWVIGTVGNTSPIITEESLNSSTNTEVIQDIVGGMVSSNTEYGISVTYTDSNGKLNFNVNDPVVALSGDATGSATMTNLNNITIAVDVNNSDRVDGLHITQGTRNNEANRVVKTDGSGYIQAGWINTTSGNASTSTIDRIYASHDSYLRYYTPINFANQILALGSVKNAHTHYGSQTITSVSNASRDIGVAEILRWKAYGNGHVIFDASAGTAPDGSSVSRTNPDVYWSTSSRPTLMGWNGSNTYGVRVDSCRRADSAANADNATNANYATNAGHSSTSNYSTTSGTANNAEKVLGLTVKKGSAQFNSSSGRTVYISGFSNSGYAVSITPKSNPNGNLGEVWYTKYTDRFIVYNSGTFTGWFDYIIIG